ncbi:MAG: diacylglycerol kinase family protein [Candidatus Aminicenantales bacterium]|jgi:diacylglycerol kinase family enzyme
MTEETKWGRVACLINPRAANSKWLRRKMLRAYLQKKLPGEIYDVFGDTRTTIEQAKKASNEADVIVAMGGDGTIADTLQGIFEAGKAKDVLFSVIPFGSGNAFRKSFGIPKNPRRAIDHLAAGVPRTIDLLEVEGRHAAFASVGATARVTSEKLQHSIEGIWGHFLAGRRLYGSRTDEKEIELYDGTDRHGPFEHKTLHSKFFDCIVTKTNYFGYGWHIAPRARVDDGYLDITLFELGPVKYTLLFPLIYLGLYQKRQRHFKAKRVVIKGRDLPIQYNGEFLGNRDRIEFKVLPRAIRIICPPGGRGKKKFEYPD